MTWPSQGVLSQLESCSDGHLMACCSEEPLGKPRMLPQHSLTCFLLSRFQLPPLAKEPCSRHAVHRFFCKSEISMANVTFSKSREPGNTVPISRDEIQTNHWIFGRSCFPVYSHQWGLITCTSHTSARNPPEGIQPAQLTGRTSHLQSPAFVLPAFLQLPFPSLQLEGKTNLEARKSHLLFTS